LGLLKHFHNQNNWLLTLNSDIVRVLFCVPPPFENILVALINETLMLHANTRNSIHTYFWLACNHIKYTQRNTQGKNMKTKRLVWYGLVWFGMVWYEYKQRYVNEVIYLFLNIFIFVFFQHIVIGFRCLIKFFVKVRTCAIEVKDNREQFDWTKEHLRLVRMFCSSLLCNFPTSLSS
jgi:hypothetical protein